MATSVPLSIIRDCSLERWLLLPPARRRTIARTIAESLNANGYGFTRWRIEGQHPNMEQPVLIFTDARTHLDFALVPGGTLLPGYDEAQLQRYYAIFAIVEGAEEADDEESDDVSGPHQGWEPLDQPRIFGSQTPCNLNRKPPVPIAPFLMAVTPLLAGTPGLTEVVPLRDVWGETWDELAANHEPAPLRWESVAPILEASRWDLPTSEQWEWAAQGGRSGVFYWGDEVPRFVVNPFHLYGSRQTINPFAEYAREKDAEIALAWSDEERALLTDAVAFDDIMARTFPPSRPRIWPYVNRFGLAGLFSYGEWCAPNTAPNHPFPLIVRGGAADCHPWQSCREWMLLLRAMERRLNTQTTWRRWQTLRPILRLQSRGA